MCVCVCARASIHAYVGRGARAKTPMSWMLSQPSLPAKSPCSHNPCVLSEWVPDFPWPSMWPSWKAISECSKSGFVLWQRNGALFSNITSVGKWFLNSKQLHLQIHFWNMTHLYAEDCLFFGGGGNYPCTAVFCLKYIMFSRSEALARFLPGRVGFADFNPM